jgi:hypothetical protein
VRVHRRRGLAKTDTALEAGIPVTAVTRTVLDLTAIGTDGSVLHSAINEADRLDLIDPEALRAALDLHVGEPGVGRLRALLDRETFTLYHRTAARQARDRRRDQAHTAAGLVPLRFTRAQVKFESELVRATLGAVARRITSVG